MKKWIARPVLTHGNKRTIDQFADPLHIQADSEKEADQKAALHFKGKDHFVSRNFNSIKGK